jgi:hypothetical protein
MITFRKAYGNESYPKTVKYPSTASETYVLGEGLKVSSGALTCAGATDKPAYIVAKPYVAPATGNEDLYVTPVLPHYEYEVDTDDDLSGAPIGGKLKLDSTATKVVASAGTHQYTTATAAGTVTAAGNAAVTVTSALLSGGSKAIAVAVALNDNAAAIATKIRAALAADTDIKAVFNVSGETTAIILTPKVWYADDSTLNIAIDDGTGEGASEGVTTAATSTTTAGVVTGNATLLKYLSDDSKAIVRFE